MNDRAPNPSSGAYTRLERHVLLLAEQRGIAVAAVLDPDHPTFEGGPKVYRVILMAGSNQTALRVDDDVLNGSDEFFRTFVLPQIAAAIDKLAQS